MVGSPLIWGVWVVRAVPPRTCAHGGSVGALDTPKLCPVGFEPPRTRSQRTRNVVTLYCLHTAHEHRSHAVTTSAQKAVPVGLNSNFRWVSRRGSPGTSPTAASAPLVRLRKRGFFASAPDSEGPFSRSVTHSTERQPGPGGALPMSGSPVTSPIPSLNTLHLSPTAAGGATGQVEMIGLSPEGFGADGSQRVTKLFTVSFST